MFHLDIYTQPTKLSDALDNLAKPGACLLAGGTDLLPQMRASRRMPAVLIDISRLLELKSVYIEGDFLHIGALTTFDELQANHLIKTEMPALAQAALQVGSPMTRSRATIGGNIANASPAADSLPPLLVRDASLVIKSSSGERRLSLKDFISAPGITALRPGEMITEIIIVRFFSSYGESFLKVGPRHAMTIAVVNVATWMRLNEFGGIEQVRITLGAVAPTVVRCTSAEACLIGKKPDPKLWVRASQLALEDISPIDDVRGSSEYRRQVSRILVQRALQAACEMALRRME